MNKPNNVIDLKARRSTKGPSEEKVGNNAAPILDMTGRRNEMLTHERRKVRRTILSEFIGAHIVVPERGLQKVTIYDISEEGVAFDIEVGSGKFVMGEEVGFRVYLNQQTYFPFVVKVANIRTIHEEGVIRHGGMFAKGTVNDVALHHFVKFIETVSASLRTDNGDIMVSGLRK
jgi:hypothetical protein